MYLRSLQGFCGFVVIVAVDDHREGSRDWIP